VDLGTALVAAGMAMEVLVNQDLREQAFGYLPLAWRAMLCRVCKALDKVVRGDGLD